MGPNFALAFVWRDLEIGLCRAIDFAYQEHLIWSTVVVGLYILKRLLTDFTVLVVVANQIG